MCIGYSDQESTIEPGSFHSVSRSFSDKKKFPDFKTHRSISNEDWEALLRSIDTTVLAAFVEQIGYPGCADEMVEWAELQFNDGTKKWISYNAGTGPSAIATLVKRCETIGSNPQPNSLR